MDYKIVAPVEKANCSESQQRERRGKEERAPKFIWVSHLLPQSTQRTSNYYSVVK